MSRVLYISHDGVREALGRSQVLAYLYGLSGKGVSICLLSFEKGWRDPRARAELDRLRQEIEARGIRWRWLRYHRRPTILATFYDVVQGAIWAAWFVVRERIGIIHARSYVPALIGWMLKRLFGAKLLFDMRGLWADQRVEGGLWPQNGLRYRLAKAFERRFLREADAIVSLTQAARPEIERLAPFATAKSRITVIPTCVDLGQFRVDEPARVRPHLGLEGRFPVIYAGALGTWYLLEEMLHFFAVLRDRVPQAHFLILSSASPQLIRTALARAPVPAPDVIIAAVPFAEMPVWLAVGRLGLFFLRPAFSSIAACPTKLGEFLACGVPVVISAGIGDADALVRRERVGVVVEKFTLAEFQRAVDEVLELLQDDGLTHRCRRVAEREFSLAIGVDRYLGIYRRLGHA